MNTPIEIDWLLKTLNHTNLDSSDICYYFMEYTARGGYGVSEANQLILNFKKDPINRGGSSWHWKENAIQRIAKIYSSELHKIVDLKTSTLIPVPPSKCRSNERYDDRMTRLLDAATTKFGADIREVLYLENDMVPSHEGNNRDVSDIESQISIDLGKCNDIRDNIVLFDDVLVTGAHFAACRNIITNLFPDKKVYGVFIARAMQ